MSRWCTSEHENSRLGRKSFAFNTRSGFFLAIVRLPVEMVRAEIAVRVGDVKHQAVETGVPVVRSSTCIGEMEDPDSDAYGIVPPKMDKGTRTILESQIHSASVWKWNIVSEAKQTAIGVEERLPTPRIASGKLEAGRATAAVDVTNIPAAVSVLWCAIRNVSVIDGERFEIQIAGYEQVRRS